MKKLAFLLILATTVQAADIVPERVDMLPVRVVHVRARKAAYSQQPGDVLLVVEAVGLVGSTGWTEATLVPRNDGGHAEDGYLEFDLQARPPGNAAGVVQSIDASISITKLDPTKLCGVRVYGGGESIAEHKLAPAKGK